jgi:ribosome-associated protein YbcJ (S4-like RNA binding protein)
MVVFYGSDVELYDENVISDIVSSGPFRKGKVIYGNVKIRGNNEWAKDEQIYDGQLI